LISLSTKARCRWRKSAPGTKRRWSSAPPATTEAEQKELARLSAQIPLVWSSNFSVGVNALFWLTRKAAGMLGPEFDVEIVEMHHRMKKDAPSGTAKTLAQIVTDGRRPRAAGVLRHGREGLVGERTAEEIGVHSLRGGDVVGDHTVIFAAAANGWN
jgi:4-hydroxy-tetrahydrodipicolinate reductase